MLSCYRHWLCSYQVKGVNGDSTVLGKLLQTVVHPTLLCHIKQFAQVGRKLRPRRAQIRKNTAN